MSESADHEFEESRRRGEGDTERGRRGDREKARRGEGPSAASPCHSVSTSFFPASVLDKFEFSRSRDGLGAVVDAQLVEHIMDVPLGRANADDERLRNFRVRLAFGQ